MYHFRGDDLSKIYVQVTKRILDEGAEISKDGRHIKEIYPAVLCLEDPRQAILAVQNRPYSPAFLVAETLWNLTAQTNDWLTYYNQKYGSFFTKGRLPAGYGNRIFNWKGETDQLAKVVEMLHERPVSQHANIIVFDPSSDLDNPVFVPCITMLKFKIRNDKLEMGAYLRAQDMWLGFPYDVHLLLSIFQLVATRLNMEMGLYYHHCDVLRVYEEHYTAAATIAPLETTLSTTLEMELNPEDATQRLGHYKDQIKELPEDLLSELENEPEYWRNALKTCYAYKLIRRGDYAEATAVVKSITNFFKEQFSIWSKAYYPTFHNLLENETH